MRPDQPGPAVVVAHVDSKTGPAVFHRLRDLKPGGLGLAGPGSEKRPGGVGNTGRASGHGLKGSVAVRTLSSAPAATLNAAASDGWESSMKPPAQVDRGLRLCSIA